MATYKENHGTNIETVTSDPSNPVNGQVWYNSTDQVLKGFTSNPAGTWATSGAMNTGRRGGGSKGSQTSGIAVGGNVPPGTGKTELFNGSSWTEVNDLGTARRGQGTCAVVNTAAIAFGGEQSPSAWYTLNESWNGSSWTEVNDLNAGRVSILAIGSSTAGLALGGVANPTHYEKNESWNGTSFTEIGDMNTGRYGSGATAGTQTSGLAWTNQSGYATDSESWNGSAWTATPSLNTAKIQDGGAGADNTSAISFGGYTTGFNNIANTEQWNGSAWAETNDLNTAVGYQFNGGSATAGWSAGGLTGGSSNATATELWNAPTTSTVTFTVS
jgi:hypothetical protein